MQMNGHLVGKSCSHDWTYVLLFVHLNVSYYFVCYVRCFPFLDERVWFAYVQSLYFSVNVNVLQ